MATIPYDASPGPAVDIQYPEKLGYLPQSNPLPTSSANKGSGQLYILSGSIICPGVLQFVGFEAGDHIPTAEGTAVQPAQAEYVTDIKHAGEYSLKLTHTGSTPSPYHILHWDVLGTGGSFDVPEAFFRVYVRFEEFPEDESVFMAWDWDKGGGTPSNYRIYFTINEDGELAACDAVEEVDRNGTLELGQWYRIEVHAEVETTELGEDLIWSCRLDGVDIMDGLASGTATGYAFNVLYLGVPSLNEAETYPPVDVDVVTYFDDVFVSSCDWPGPGFTRCYVPHADGDDTDWTGDYTNIREVPHDGDTTVIESNLTGDRSLFVYDAPAGMDYLEGVKVVTLSNAPDLTAIQSTPYNLLAKEDTDEDTFETIARGAGHGIGIDWIPAMAPSGGEWTWANLRETQFGVENLDNEAVEITALYVMVSIDGDPPAGVVCGGSALVGCVYSNTGMGGVVCGGSAFSEVVISGDGGVVCNGTASSMAIYNPTVSGGVVCNGSSDEDFRDDVVTEGGVVCGGSAFSEVVVGVSGGVVCGGSASSMAIYNPTASGGVVCSGDVGTVNEIASGGVVCGGDALVTVVYNIVVSGGVVCSGESLVDHILLVGGGIVCSGSANLLVDYYLTASGGVVCDGDPRFFSVITPPTSGGIVCGGDSGFYALVLPDISGGAICSGDALDEHFIHYGGVACSGTSENFVVYSLTRNPMAENISVVLSGGSHNFNPDLALGGNPSGTPIVDDTLNNIFDDASATDAQDGLEDYRCFYFFNDNAMTIYNVKVFIVEDFEDGAVIEMGIEDRDASQRIHIFGHPTGGSLVLSYAGIEFTSEFNADFGDWAIELQDTLNALVDEDDQPLLEDIQVTGQVTDSSLIFDVLFAGNDGSKAHDTLVVVENNLTPTLDVSVLVLQSGAPVNTIAPEISNEGVPPGGVTFSVVDDTVPFTLEQLKPGEGFPVWLKRTIEAGTSAVADDGVRIRFLAESLSTGA